MKTHDIDAAVRDLDPNRTEVRPSDAAWAELADAIVASDTGPVVGLDRRRRSARPRVLLAAACSLVVVGVVAAALVNQSGQDQPQALSFTERGDKLIIRVVDPKADPKQYNAEFKKMGLNIKVNAVPVSPPFVGVMVDFSAQNDKQMQQLHLLEPGEKCNGTLTAADPGCQEGLEVPKDYDGKTVVNFGRAAKPGEMYHHTSSSATDKGEVLAGLTLKNKTVDQALPLIKARGVQRITYLTGDGPQFDSKDSVPGDWYVHDTSTYAPGEVSLYVGPSPEK
ncbi:hypothetical protein AB0L70_00335 [Kribbella sp. NPDC051952]|uniref:hypothetical protein n=1 Tax=Kribbella sp. NPDC051952 TaxID=3154851 RepID=UPI00343E2DCD